MINAAIARKYTFNSGYIKHYADAMSNLYDEIDSQIEAEAKKGKMYMTFCLKTLTKKHLKTSLTLGQLYALADIIKTKYESDNFKVKVISYSYLTDTLIVEIGWFNLETTVMF